MGDRIKELDDRAFIILAKLKHPQKNAIALLIENLHDAIAPHLLLNALSCRSRTLQDRRSPWGLAEVVDADNRTFDEAGRAREGSHFSHSLGGSFGWFPPAMFSIFRCFKSASFLSA